MVEPQPTQVGVFVERQLDQLAGAIEKDLSADVMAIYGPIYSGAENRVREVIEARRGKRKPKLAVVLDTTGGIIEVVERMVQVIRHHYKEVVMIVPNRAMSAGTVLALSGDAIMMDYFSCLGPIDPQIEIERGNLVPARSYLIQYEKLKAKEGSPEGLAAAEIVLLQKLDLAELHSFEEAIKLSDSLLREWLAKYKFKEWKVTETRKLPVDDKKREERAHEIAEQLADCEEWHSHGRPISKDVLEKKLNLRIDDFGAKPALSRAIGRYHDFLVDYMGKISAFHFVHTKGTCLFLTWSQR
jgi:ClpP class serine protease